MSLCSFYNESNRIVSKPSLIRSNGGGGSSVLSGAKGSPTTKKKIRTQINGKFNDISSADENK
jgi:hypothetical protein